MSYSIEMTKMAQKTIKKWKKSNSYLYRKLYDNIFPELVDHPRTGIGHPEPLKSGGGITYSRRISAHDRIIYDIYDDTITVLVIEVEGHYDDK